MPLYKANILYRVGGTCRVYRLHSIVYSLLLATPGVGITVILYSRFWPPDVLCGGGLLMSSRLERWLPTDLTSRLEGWMLTDLTSRCRLYFATDCFSSYSSLLRKHNSICCVGNVGIRNQLLHSSVSNRLRSRCLGMDVPSICSIGKSITILWKILLEVGRLFWNHPLNDISVHKVSCGKGTKVVITATLKNVIVGRVQFQNTALVSTLDPPAMIYSSE
jgi:hypothetical protein